MKIYVYTVSYHCADDFRIETKVYTDFDTAKKKLDLSHQINLDELEDDLLDGAIETGPYIDTYSEDCTEYEFKMAEDKYGNEWCHIAYSIKEFEI